MLIAAFCERLTHFSFFRRLVSPLADAGHEMIFISNRLSVVLSARRCGYRSLFMHGYRQADSSLYPGKISRFNIKGTGLSLVDAEQCLLELKSFHKIVLVPLGVSAYFFWNGSSFLAREMTSLAKEQKSKTLFFELGNFPGKIVVDPEGVNAKSWFAHHFSKICKDDLDMDKFERWRENYLTEKLYEHRVQQVSFANKFNLYYPLDVFGFYFLSAPYSEAPDILRRTWRYLRSYNVKYVYDEFDPASFPGYIFFPLQVSTDSQLLVHSDLDNLEALRRAAEMAEARSVKLVVKPHPAEGDRVFVRELAALRSQLGFLFVNHNIFQLMKNSSRVVTINSTAGLEALLLDKPVTVFGRAMYEHFSKEDLAYYLMKYLINIDYYSEEDVSKDQLSAVLERMEISQ